MEAAEAAAMRDAGPAAAAAAAQSDVDKDKADLRVNENAEGVEEKEVHSEAADAAAEAAPTAEAMAKTAAPKRNLPQLNAFEMKSSWAGDGGGADAGEFGLLAGTVVQQQKALIFLFSNTTTTKGLVYCC